MTNSRTTKKALLSSALALTLCVAMLIATTFAWFTDTASTSVNKIQAGKLDVALYYGNSADGARVTVWNPINDNSDALGWMQKESAEGTVTMVTTENQPLWEPGCTFSLPALKIVNEGDLALKYKILISGIKGDAELNDVITWTMELSETNEILGTEHSLAAKPTAGESADYFTISGHMDENAGNDYQGKSIDGISITVIATQDAAEFDSTRDNYDADATYPVHSTAAVKTTTTEVDDVTTTMVAAQVEIKSEAKVNVDGESVPVATAVIPVNVVLEEGTTKLTFDIQENTDENNITVTSDQSKKTLEITVRGVDNTRNTTPLTITHYIESGLTGLTLYHNNTKMTSVNSEPDLDANKYYYESTTGKLVLKSATFSPFTYVFDAPGMATVTTRAELEAALKDATISTIKLGSNIACSEDDTSAIEVLRDVTIDFNGNVLGIGLESGSIEHGSDGSGLVLTDSTNSENSGVQSEIKVFDTGGFQQFAAVMAWQSKVTINSGKYSHDNVVVGSQLQASSQQDGLIINGGTFEGKGSASTIYNCFGTITVNGGTFSAEHEDGGDCIYVDSGSSYMSSITNINGGKFTSADRMIYVKVDTKYGQKVNISGGDFTVGTGDQLVVFSDEVADVKDYISITGGTFNVDPSAYVADGYKATKNNNTWTVSKS